MIEQLLVLGYGALVGIGAGGPTRYMDEQTPVTSGDAFQFVRTIALMSAPSIVGMSSSRS